LVEEKWWGNLKEREHLEDLDRNKKILKMGLNK
jgi:hypothetical protein